MLRLRQTEVKIANKSSIHVNPVERLVDVNHHFKRLIRLDQIVTSLLLTPNLTLQVIAYDCILTWSNANVKCNVTAC